MQDKVTRTNRPNVPVTPFARRFIRMALGFGVGVGIGLAPFLGTIGVPGFAALISLFPETLKFFLIPSSAFLMGVIAVGAQFYSTGKPIGHVNLGKLMRRCALLTGGGLLVLVVAYFILVARVSFTESLVIPFVVGLDRDEACECSPSISDSQCIIEISANPGSIETCWGSRQIRLGELTLSLLYLGVTGAFGFLIGLVLLQEQAKTEGARRQARHKRYKRTKKAKQTTNLPEVGPRK